MNKMSRRKTAALLSALVALIYFIIYSDLFQCQKVFVHDNIIWYGSFHYFVESIADGNFPFWNPFMMSGTYYYPNISLLGLLDPSVLVGAAVMKVFGLSPLTIYIYVRLFRLFVMIAGGYLLYREVTGCHLSATVFAAVLLFSLSAAYFNQNGIVDLIFLTPAILFCVIRFLVTDGRNRYFFLVSAALLIGITMNVFIPSYFLFNFLLFFGIAAFLAQKPLSIASGVFKGRPLIIVSLCILLLTMMAAPPFSVLAKDASSEGELFPILRIWQKAGFRQIMATDVATGSLSKSFSGHRALFSSLGNIVHLIYPDVGQSFPYFLIKGLMAENNMYIGIIPFVLAIIGVLYHKSRYRILSISMIVLIGVNMFRLTGMSGEFNLLQRFFNFVFPPLQMIDVRQSFGSYIILYLGMLGALGASLLYGSNAEEFARAKKKGLLAVVLGVILIKSAITWEIGGKLFFSSSLDLFVQIQLLLFAAGVFFLGKRKLRHTAFVAATIVIVLADLSYYNAFTRPYVLMDSSMLDQMIEGGNSRKSPGEFEYYRTAFPLTPELAFGENIINIKGALTPGNNHSPFCTKRYYDFLTHVPIRNQLILSGTVSPVFRFFETGSVLRFKSKNEVLDFLAKAGENVLTDGMAIEDPGESSAGRGALAALEEYPPVPSLDPGNVLAVYGAFITEKGNPGFQNDILKRRFLDTSEYSIRVLEHSPNRLTVSVENIRDGFLLYNDGWSSYWKAFEGEHEIPIYAANYNSKAVYVRPGKHVVRFIFSPQHYTFALALYFSGLLIFLVMLAWSGFLSMSRKTPTSNSA